MEEPLEVGENWLCQADATRCVGVARVILITRELCAKELRELL